MSKIGLMSSIRLFVCTSFLSKCIFDSCIRTHDAFPGAASA